MSNEEVMRAIPSLCILILSGLLACKERDSSHLDEERPPLVTTSTATTYAPTNIKTSADAPDVKAPLSFIGDVHDNPNYDLATRHFLMNERVKADVIFLEAFYSPTHFKTRSIVGDLADIPIAEMTKENVREYLKRRKFDWYETKYENLYELIQNAKSRGVAVVGIDRARLALESPMTWRTSPSLNGFWTEKVSEYFAGNAGKRGIIYAGSEHADLLRNYGYMEGLSSNIYDIRGHRFVHYKRTNIDSIIKDHAGKPLSPEVKVCL